MRLVCRVWVKGDRGERTAGMRSGLGVQQGLAGGVEVVAGFLPEGLVGGLGGVALPALARQERRMSEAEAMLLRLIKNVDFDFAPACPKAAPFGAEAVWDQNIIEWNKTLQNHHSTASRTADPVRAFANHPIV